MTAWTLVRKLDEMLDEARASITPLTYTQLLTQMRWQVLLDEPYLPKTFSNWHFVITRELVTDSKSFGLLLASEALHMFLRRNMMEKSTQFVQMRMMVFDSPNRLYDYICSIEFQARYKGHETEYQAFRKKAWEELRSRSGWQTTRWEWMGYMRQLHHALRKRRIAVAANVLACSLEELHSDVDRWGQCAMFSHPEVVKRARRLWSYIEPEMTPEFLPEIRELVRGYGWRI